MDHLDEARQIVDTMLGYLGFVVHVADGDNGDNGADGDNGNRGLQIFTEEAEWLIGRHGERLDDIQYLVNRILQAQHKGAPRVRVDVEHYRTMREDDLVKRVRGLAEKVRATGRPVRLFPMNSYNRRIVHNAFAHDPDIESQSGPERTPLKQITLRKRKRRSGGTLSNPQASD